MAAVCAKVKLVAHCGDRRTEEFNPPVCSRSRQHGPLRAAQLRTLQRFIKTQRVAAAQKLLQEVIGEAPAPAAISGVSDTERPARAARLVKGRAWPLRDGRHSEHRARGRQARQPRALTENPPMQGNTTQT